MCDADINECAKKSVTAPLRCVNSQGSYHYECENGYRLVNSTQCQGKANILRLSVHLNSFVIANARVFLTS